MKCNNIKCRKEIHKIALVTHCFHIFCQSCLIYIKKSKLCTACKTTCKDNDTYLREYEVKPNLFGLSPSDILEISREALTFWLYQNDQEHYIQQAIKDEIENKYVEIKQEMKVMKSKFEIEIESLKNALEKTERSLERERENYYELGLELENKAQQYQKLLLLTEKCKIKNHKLNDITNIKEISNLEKINKS